MPRPYFQEAHWLWRKIGAGPALDPNSAAMAALLAQGSHSALLVSFGVVIREGAAITGATPRYDIAFRNAIGGSSGLNWGPDPFGTDTVPIPAGTPVAPGSDAHIAIADGVNGVSYAVWQATKTTGPPESWVGSWGAKVPLGGDGREPNIAQQGSSTGARLARLAGVIRESEIAAGVIEHALFFSTDMASAVVRYPAQVGDGANGAGVATPIPEGARVQLDPSIDLAAIPGITSMELTVGRALQQYGAYCGDNGGARMAFLFEYKGTTVAENQVYWDAMTGRSDRGDYFDMSALPWSSLRVLEAWDSGTQPTTAAIDVSYVGGSSWATGTTGATVAYPGGLAAGDRLYTFVHSREAATVLPASIGPWSKTYEQSIGSGIVGSGTGPTRWTVYERTVPAGGLVGVYTFAGFGTAAVLAMMHAVRPSALGDDVTIETAWESYSHASSTAIGGTTGAMALAAKDLLLIGVGSPDDTTVTLPVSTIAASGATFGAITSVGATLASPTGNDHAAAMYRVPVTAGTSTGGVTLTGTANAAETGGSVVLRIRALIEQAPVVGGDATRFFLAS